LQLSSLILGFTKLNNYAIVLYFPRVLSNKITGHISLKANFAFVSSVKGIPALCWTLFFRLNKTTIVQCPIRYSATLC